MLERQGATEGWMVPADLKASLQAEAASGLGEKKKVSMVSWVLCWEGRGSMMCGGKK